MTRYRHPNKDSGSDLNLSLPASCDEAAPRLKAWLDHELCAAEAARVSAHVAQCERCRSTADDFRDITGTLRTALDVAPVQPSARVALSAMSLARDVALGERELVSSLQRVALAAAALLVVGIALVFALPDQPRGSLDQVLELALQDDVWAEEF